MVNCNGLEEEVLVEYLKKLPHHSTGITEKDNNNSTKTAIS
jgi:hypothetical protein